MLNVSELTIKPYRSDVETLTASLKEIQEPSAQILEVAEEQTS